jgi:hypothetical protein
MVVMTVMFVSGILQFVQRGISRRWQAVWWCAAAASMPMAHVIRLPATRETFSRPIEIICSGRSFGPHAGSGIGKSAAHLAA